MDSANKTRSMASLLGLPIAVRLRIYRHVFELPEGEILGLSREPEHDYSKGHPDDWTADSLQSGLVFRTNAARSTPTNSQVLTVCRQINDEATTVFYGQNKIKLYAEDNNDIFYWLLDIGEQRRRAIRHLEINWAYGISIASARGNIRGLLENIAYMDESQEEEIRKRRDQLIAFVKDQEKKTVRLIIRTLHLLALGQGLVSLAVYFPGIDGGDIWDLPNDNIYFAEELFSNATANVHACIPEALAKTVGLDTLTIGYTKDILLAEEIALATGAKQLIIRVCPEGNTLNLNAEERQDWEDYGWRLEETMAYKTLISGETLMEQQQQQEDDKARKRDQQQEQCKGSEPGYSEGGRLKASMMV